MARLHLFFLILLFSVESFSQLQVIESAQLDFEPYISSYLPIKQGQLFFGKGNNPGDQLESMKVMLNSHMVMELPVIDKFEALRQKVLHLKPRKKSYYQRELYNPKAEEWEGVCNQWSAASLEPQIAKLVKNLSPINCYGISLNPAEIRELLTAFYSHVKKSKFIGDRNRADNAIRKQYEMLGYDDLPAHLFHSTLYESLKNNQGVVMDRSHHVEVMNQPIYKAQSLSLSDSKTSKVLPEVLPLDIVEADENDPAMQAVLKELQKAEKAFKERAEKLISRQNRKSNLLEKWSEESPNQLKYLPVFAEQKKALLASGRVHLKKGYKFKSVETSVHYKVEKEFAAAIRDSRGKKNDYYSYVLIEKDGKTVDSMWITEPDERPDFIWVPSQQITDNKTFRKYSEEMDELISIIEKCKPAQEVGVFYSEFDKAANDGNIDGAEKKALQKKWKSLKPFIDKDWIYSNLKTIRGMSKEELN